MSTGSPWSVKGIDPEAREAAKIAARKSGMTVGAWLNQTIRAAAAEQLANGGPSHPQVPPQAAARDPAQTATSYAPYRQQAGPAAGQSPPPAPTMEAIFESIQKLTSRVEAAEVRTTSAIAPLAEQVDQLAARIDEVKANTDVSTAPVERAVMRLSERLQRLEETDTRRTRPGRWRLFRASG